MRPMKNPSHSIRLRALFRAALLGATAVVLVGVGGAPVLADELGDLKTQMQTMQKKIADLEAKQAKTAKVAAAAAERQSQAAPERMITSGNPRVKLALSGQVNRVSFYANDGTESNFFHSDNENSSTRWRLVGSARINDYWTVGTLIEQDIGQTNNSASVVIDQDTSASDVSFDNRHLLVYLDSKRFGRLWLGKGDTASNNIAQFDLSGTSVIEYSGLEDVGGSLRFRVDGAKLFGPKVSAGSDGIGAGVYSQFDGLSRRNRIQYDTPTMMGFKAGVSHSQGDAWDVTLRYKADYKQVGLKVAAGIGYWEFGERTDVADSGYGGSISVLHDSGANLTFSGGTLDRGKDVDIVDATADDPWGIFIKPGWQLNLTMLGKTAISGHYAWTENLFTGQDADPAKDLAAFTSAKDGDEFTSWGGSVVQFIDAAAMELFLFYRQYNLDGDVDFEDIDIAGVGARVKF